MNIYTRVGKVGAITIYTRAGGGIALRIRFLRRENRLHLSSESARTLAALLTRAAETDGTLH